MTATAVSIRSGLDVCSRCLARRAGSSSTQSIYRSSIYTKRKLHGTIVPDKPTQRNMLVTPQLSFHDYFSANTTIDRGWVKSGVLAAWRTIAAKPRKPSEEADHSLRRQDKHAVDDISSAPEVDTRVADSITQSSGVRSEDVPVTSSATPHSHTKVLPHRRRRRKIVTESEDGPKDIPLPLDASSQLATAAASLPSSASMRRRLATYLSLTKPRLSFLILLTTTSAYSLYPIPDILSSDALGVVSSTLSTSTLTLAFLTTGTFLSCASANTFNMLFEPKYDALMSRTRNRPLVRNLVSRRAAAMFGIACGVVGLALLDFGTNSTVAGLSALNIFLYAGVYTPMKRLSWMNTWVGAVVGAIPPLMGWCAAAGQAATSEHHSWQDMLFSESSIGGWLLAALLFAWQFPHFNSLSHTIRDDYRNAGHKMLAWMNPARNARVALRYSLAMFPICAGLYLSGIVDEAFLVISTGCNIWMTREAVKFWRQQGTGGSARGLFWASVWQLPLVLVGALVCKRGIWDGFFSRQEDVMAEDQKDELDTSLGMSNPVDVKARRSDHTSHNLAMMGSRRPS